MSWKPGNTAPMHGRDVLLYARLLVHPFEPKSFFQVIGYYNSASGVGRWKSRETDNDLEVQLWAPVLDAPGRED